MHHHSIKWGMAQVHSGGIEQGFTYMYLCIFSRVHTQTFKKDLQWHVFQIKGVKRPLVWNRYPDSDIWKRSKVEHGTCEASYTPAAKACWGEWKAAGSQEKEGEEEEEKEVRVVASMVPWCRKCALPAGTEPARCALPVSAHAVIACVLTPSMYRPINNTEMQRITTTKESKSQRDFKF